MYKSALQKLFVLLLMITLPVFIMKRHKLFRDRTAYVSSEQHTQERVINDKHFVVTMPITLPLKKVESSLKNLMDQGYENYEIIFINSMESNQIHSELQQLYSKVEKELNKKGPSYSIKTNYYESIHQLKDNDIVIYLEAGDWLAKKSTMEKLATIFSNTDVWLAYSPYIEYPSYQHKLEHPIKEEKWWKLHARKTEWLKSPLKVFYAGLFKEINFETVQSKNWQPAIQLNVFLTPMVDNASKHIIYIKEVLYYHDDTDSNLHNVMVYDPT
ncbi:MAG: glycosyltransferase family A protein [Rhabdochlamydiaceae bacterium]|nr:glycosyltransferase family A protein [Candidatus Amphrikana amoebophyrae]